MFNPQPSSTEHEWLTRKEAAYLLRLSPDTLAVWAVKRRFAKELPVFHLGSRVRYRSSDVYRLMRGEG